MHILFILLQLDSLSPGAIAPPPAGSSLTDYLGYAICTAIPIIIGAIIRKFELRSKRNKWQREHEPGKHDPPGSH